MKFVKARSACRCTTQIVYTLGIKYSAHTHTHTHTHIYIYKHTQASTHTITHTHTHKRLGTYVDVSV